MTEKLACILIIVMTHANENDVLHSKDTHYPANEFRLWFTTKQCPSLAGKPKLFIFQVFIHQINRNQTYLKKMRVSSLVRRLVGVLNEAKQSM